MKYAILKQTHRGENVSQELVIIVSAKNAREALWRAGIDDINPGNGVHYDAVNAHVFSAHVGGRYDSTSYMKNAS